LTRQTIELKTELHAARLAAAAARTAAAASTSVWRLPRLLADSAGVHALSARWLEEAPGIKGGGSEHVPAVGGRRTLVACALVAAATVVMIGIFLFCPRYLL
jgi:hypothetical protein